MKIDTRLQFLRLAAAWKKEVAATSSMSEMTGNANYQAIIAMGYEALPFIIDSMRKEPNWWFIALKEITGADPVPFEDYGYLQKLTDGWIKWYDEEYLKR